MKLRTKQFAVRIVSIVRSLPKTRKVMLLENNCFVRVLRCGKL